MRQLTKAQKKWALEHAKGKGQKASAEIAYPNTKYPGALGYQLASNSRVMSEVENQRQRLQRALEKHDATAERYAKTVAESMDATIGEEPDHRTRLMGAKELREVSDWKPVEKHAHIHRTEGSFFEQLKEKAQED